MSQPPFPPAPLAWETLERQARQLVALAQRRLGSFGVGSHGSLWRGRGQEIAEVRRYEPGDDVRLMDWKATARRGQPYVKHLLQERRAVVWLLLDRSGSMALAGLGRAKEEAALELVALLALAAQKQQDAVGLASFGGPPLLLPPRAHLRQAMLLVTALLRNKTNNESSNLTKNLTASPHAPLGDGANLAACIKEILPFMHARANIFVLSDFLFPNAAALLAPLARRHAVHALQITASLEENLPPRGLVRFADAETGQTRVVDTSCPRFQAAYAAAAHQRRACLQRELTALGIEFIPMSDEADCLPILLSHWARAHR